MQGNAVTGPDSFLLAFPTRAGRSYTIEFRNRLGGGAWVPFSTVRSVGLEQTLQWPLLPSAYFRVREE